MDRRAFLGLAGGLLAAPLAAEAQPAGKVVRIGYLTIDLAAASQTTEAFRRGLRNLGYVEGRNVMIEYRDAERKVERLPALAAELVAFKVDVIVVGGSTVAALAAKQATRTLPIVFASAGDPVGSGLVTNLARPGGNVTGLSNLTSELVGKRLELVTQAVPGVSQVAVLRLPGALGERTAKDMLTGAEVAARERGVRLQFVEARGPDEFDRAFSDMTRARPRLDGTRSKKNFGKVVRRKDRPTVAAPRADPSDWLRDYAVQVRPGLDSRRLLGNLSDRIASFLPGTVSALVAAI